MALSITAHGNRLASMGRAITIEVDDQTLNLRAPFYRRSIPRLDISSVEAQPDDGRNHGLVNWFVVGRAHTPQGVRLNTGGKARVDITTRDHSRYGVVVDTMQQAEQIVAALETS